MPYAAAVSPALDGRSEVPLATGHPIVGQEQQVEEPAVRLIGLPYGIEDAGHEPLRVCVCSGPWTSLLLLKAERGLHQVNLIVGWVCQEDDGLTLEASQPGLV
jgi:hypothetical protein